METYAGAYPAVLAGGGRSILYGKRDACLARIWLVADADGGWLMLMVGGTYFLFMDVKLMLLMIRHEEKKKWKRYRLKNKFEG